jgi:hypothetical protein
MKLKGNKLILVLTAIGLALPAILLANSATDPQAWVFRLQFLCQFFLYPILSSFAITFLIQKEYADQTIINSLTAPVGRMTFLGAKLVLWLLWYSALTLGFLAITSFRVSLKFGLDALIANWAEIAWMVLRTGFLYFCVMLPIAWIAVMQRKMFYPSLLAAILMSSSGLAGILSQGFLGSVVPWFAVLLLNMPDGDVVASVAYASIGTCAAAGVGLAARSFMKQEI